MASSKKLQNPILPNDLIENVLLRLPIKLRDRFKCVSKSWLSLLSSSPFVKEEPDHFISINHIGDPCLLALTTKNGNEGVSRKIEIPHMHRQKMPFVAGSCNGLVLIMKFFGDFMGLIVNPITLEAIQVPKFGLPSQLEQIIHNNCMYGLGYDSSEDDYKIVLIPRFDLDSRHKLVYIYSLKTKIWREVEYFPFEHHKNGQGVFVDGCLHWVAKTGSGDETFVMSDFDLGTESGNKTFVISAFNLATEEFENVSYPKDMEYANYHDYDHLTVLGGCLALVFGWTSFGRSTNVWLMKEYGVRDSWTRFMEIHVHGHDVYASNFRLLCFLKEKEVVLLKDNKQFVAHDWRKAAWRDLALDGPSYLTYGSDIIGFKKSLVSPNYSN